MENTAGEVDAKIATIMTKGETAAAEARQSLVENRGDVNRAMSQLEKQEEQLKQLTHMGFEESKAQKALEANEWDVNAAADQLFIDTEEGEVREARGGEKKERRSSFAELIPDTPLMSVSREARERRTKKISSQKDESLEERKSQRQQKKTAAESAQSSYLSQFLAGSSDSMRGDYTEQTLGDKPIGHDDFSENESGRGGHDSDVVHDEGIELNGIDEEEGNGGVRDINTTAISRRNRYTAPGAVRVGGIDGEGNADVEDVTITASQHEIRVSARLVDTEEENRVIREQILQEAEIAQVVKTAPTKKRMVWGAAILVFLVIVAVAVVLALLLPRPEQNDRIIVSPTPPPSPTSPPCSFCWTQSGQTTGVATARSGSSVATSADGSVMAVGEPGLDQVRVFGRNATSDWTQLSPPIIGPFGSDFGAAVALSEDGRSIAIGGPKWGYFDGTGIVHVYRWMLPHGMWRLLHNCTGEVSSHSFGVYFGTDVALSASGKTLLVTAPWIDPHLEVWTSTNSDLDALEEWSQLSSWSPFDQQEYSYMWPTIVALSGDGSTVLAADDSTARVLKLNRTSDWQIVGSEVNGSSAVLSKDARTLAVATPYQHEIPDDIETEIYQWDEGIANWVPWGTKLPGYPLGLSSEGSTVVTATPLEIHVYQRRDDTWTMLGNGLDIEGNFSSVAVSRLIAVGPDGISLVVGELSSGDDEHGRARAYTYNDPSGESIPVADPLSFPNCQDEFTSFRFELTTDLGPEDQSWELKKNGTGEPILEGGNYTEGLTAHIYETCLPLEDCYQLRVMDGFQEGLCCLYGEGGYTLYLDEKVAATTEPTSDIAYGVYSHWFGNCQFRL